MKTNLKFNNETAYEKAFTFFNGNGECFRSNRNDLTLEFYYERDLLIAQSKCKSLLGLASKDMACVII